MSMGMKLIEAISEMMHDAVINAIKDDLKKHVDLEIFQKLTDKDFADIAHVANTKIGMMHRKGEPKDKISDKMSSVFIESAQFLEMI